MTELNAAERELLAKLIEEASEVIKEACKILNYGKLAVDGNGFQYNNVKKLSIETGDFLNMVELCRNSNLIDGQIAQESWDRKREEIWNYLKHNEQAKRFMVVKYAGMWKEYFSEDPKEKGVILEHSASFTPTGKQLGIAPFYYDEEDAKHACLKMNNENNNGYYAVCPLIEE